MNSHPILLCDANPRLMQALADYLVVNGIDCQIRLVNQQPCLILLDSSKQQQAEAEVARFLAEPDHPRYLQASWQRNEPAARWFRYEGGIDWYQLLRQTTGPLTLTLLIICWLLFGYTFITGDDSLYQALHFAAEPFTSGQLWRFISPIVLHFSLLHILMNTFWWWYLGGRIEQRLGTMTLASVALAAGLFSNLAQFFASGPLFGGLSGVVYGLFGFVFVLGKRRPELGMTLPPAMMAFLLLWIVLGFSGILITNIANMAHLAGLVTGLLLGLWYGTGQQHRQKNGSY